MARPHSTLRKRVWDMTIEQLVAQEFDYLCNLVMALAGYSYLRCCTQINNMQIVSTEVSAMSQIEHYATCAEFSDLRRPVLKEITVPESIKRRLPSKHYVSFPVHLL